MLQTQFPPFTANCLYPGFTRVCTAGRALTTVALLLVWPLIEDGATRLNRRLTLVLRPAPVAP